MKFGGAVIGAVQTSAVPEGVDAVDEWVVTGQPTSRHLYGQGLCLMEACAPAVAMRMRALSEAGLVRLHQAPIGKPMHGFCREVHFFAIRTKRPVPKGFPALAKTSGDTVMTSGQVNSAAASAARERERKRVAERKAEIALFARSAK